MRILFSACFTIFFTVCTVAQQVSPRAGKVYTGTHLQSLRIPIGGVGTGNILMGGRANLAHIEVFNRPDRVRRLEKTFFALSLKTSDGMRVNKILERELFPPFGESTHKYVAGLPRMREAVFRNTFPSALWELDDPDVPLAIELEAFSPFIPLDVHSSSFPVIAFTWNLTNPTSDSLTGSLVWNMENPIQADSLLNSFFEQNGLRGIRFLATHGAKPDDQGSMLMATPHDQSIVQTHWYPGAWRDETHIFWNDFSSDGEIASKREPWKTTYAPTSYNESTLRMASLLVPFRLAPGENKTITFYLSWYFPLRSFGLPEVFGIEAAAGKVFTNAYGRQFDDARHALEIFREQEVSIRHLSGAFGQAIQQTSVPEYVKEAVLTQAASLRTNLIQITGEGDVHGFEGVLPNGWCCPGTCTHVYNYEQTLASLYPSLEQRMREIEFTHNTFENGLQTHRSVIPLGPYWFNGGAAADGQMGTIVRAYREWKLSGNNEWLAGIWPGVKAALEFAWTGTEAGTMPEGMPHQEAWDPDQTGLLSGRQHNTYDISFYGPNSMTTSLYLAALRAGSEMAKAMGDKKASKLYANVWERGSELAADSLWNGSYFIQVIAEDPNAAADSTRYEPAPPGQKRIPKYQYGNGCLADQLLGQYLAFNAGLGYILPQSQVKQALKAIYDHNFIRPLRTFENVQRVYGLNDEGGVVLCTWPENDRPALPFVYAEEIWTGVEFQVATSLIHAGYVEEGLDIVEAIQERYDGFRRNPFEHDESGTHYARAMASWSLILALSGFHYDGVHRMLTLNPPGDLDQGATFWSTAAGWGTLNWSGQDFQINVVMGELVLDAIQIGAFEPLEFRQTRTLTPKDGTVFFVFDD